MVEWSLPAQRTPSFFEHPKCHLLSYFDHPHYTNVAYAHQLIVYAFFDFIFLQIVTAPAVFAVVSAASTCEDDDTHRWAR